MFLFQLTAGKKQNHAFKRVKAVQEVQLGQHQLPTYMIRPWVRFSLLVAAYHWPQISSILRR